MPLREQPGVPARFAPLRAHRPDAQTQEASRHAVGTSSGLHPEDRPYLTDEHQPINRQPVSHDDEDDDRLYDTRLPTSARRYAAPTTMPARTVMRVTRHQGPPPPIQRASRVQAPAYEEPQQAPISQRNGRVHPTVYIGVAMLIMIVGWMALSSLLQWWQVQQDTWHYGTPRTFQIDADVRHGGSSHFLVVNLHGHILITEMQVDALQKTKVYTGPVFSGAGTDLEPATISFQDVNGDGYPDMIIAVGTGRYLLINDHHGFRPATSTDTINGKGI
jgi:hypothetical protein